MTGEIPASAYYDQILVDGTAIAPGGERVAFTTTEYDGQDDESVSALFVVPTDGSEEPYRLTRASGVSSPKWSPDGRKLGFLATRKTDTALKADRDPESEEADDAEADDAGEPATDDDDATDGEEEQQVWMFDMQRGGDARQVTTRSEGVTEFDWGPNGERIVISARDPTDEEREYLDEREDDGPIEVERLQHKADGRGWLDDVTTYLFVVDVETREERRLDAATLGGARLELFGGRMLPAWGPDGTIAYVTNDDEDADDTYVTDLWTINPESDDPTPERITDGTLSVSSPSWSPDGERLAFSASHPRNKHVPTELYTADPSTGEYESLTPDLDRTVAGADWLTDDRLLAYIGDEGRTRPIVVTETGDRTPAFTAQAADEEVLRFGGVDVDPESGRAGLVVTTPNTREAAVLDVEQDAVTELTDYVGSFPDVDVACEKLRYESEPDVDVEAYAYWDDSLDLESGEHPVIVDIHGGPMSYDQPSYSFQTAYWAARGYIVLAVNYRGSTSYGRDFSESIRGDWGPRETTDIVAGVEHLIERGWVDADRVFVTGFSQGGVNTAYVLTRSDVATAGAAQHGIYDYRSAYGTDDSHVWWDDDFGQPWNNPDTYDRTSSITDVDQIDAPLLVTAGGEDWRCPPTQAEQLYVSVKKQDVPAKLVVYPTLPHSYGGPDDATHRLETVTDWFEEHDPKHD